MTIKTLLFSSLLGFVLLNSIKVQACTDEFIKINSRRHLQHLRTLQRQNPEELQVQNFLNERTSRRFLFDVLIGKSQLSQLSLRSEPGLVKQGPTSSKTNDLEVEELFLQKLAALSKQKKYALNAVKIFKETCHLREEKKLRGLNEWLHAMQNRKKEYLVYTLYELLTANAVAGSSLFDVDLSTDSQRKNKKSMDLALFARDNFSKSPDAFIEVKHSSEFFDIIKPLRSIAEKAKVMRREFSNSLMTGVIYTEFPDDAFFEFSEAENVADGKNISVTFSNFGDYTIQGDQEELGKTDLRGNFILSRMLNLAEEDRYGWRTLARLVIIDHRTGAYFSVDTKLFEQGNYQKAISSGFDLSI